MNRDLGDSFAAIFESSQRDSRAIVRAGPRPLSRAEENSFYGEALTATAVEIGQQSVTDNMELVSEFVVECSDDRAPCDYFGPISTPELVRSILLNKNSADEQLAAAAKEFRARLLDHFKTRVRHEAARSMEN